MAQLPQEGWSVLPLLKFYLHSISLVPSLQFSMNSETIQSVLQEMKNYPQFPDFHYHRMAVCRGMFKTIILIYSLHHYLDVVQVSQNRIELSQGCRTCHIHFIQIQNTKT